MHAQSTIRLAAATATPLVSRPTYGQPRNALAALIVAVPLLIGCSDYKPASPSAPGTTPPVAQPAKKAPETVRNETPPPALPDSAAVTKSPETVQEKAAVGAGAQGHGYGSGPVATPAATFFRAREKIAFDIQIPEAMKLFKATEDRAPRTHEEFMERIIKEQHISLPKLNPDRRYRYDPKTEQLMIEHLAP